MGVITPEPSPSLTYDADDDAFAEYIMFKSSM